VKKRTITAQVLGGAVLAALAVVSAAGCGRDEPTRLIAEGADQEPLPTLPPVDERHPELFADNGCLETGAGATDCATRSEDLDAAAASPAGGPDVDRQLLGFRGTGYLTRPGSGSVVVLEDSIRVEPAAGWTAIGLVRNETSDPVTGVVVRAELIGATGAVIGTVEGPVPVGPLRAGEPAPFELVSSTPADEVAEVRWSTGAEPVADARADGGRGLEIVTFRSRAYGDPATVDNYLYRDDGGGPHPFLLFGSVTNYGPSAEGATVTAAWRAPDGRVLRVEQTNATCSIGLDSGGSCDFVLVVDDAAAGPALAGATPVLWAVAA
jgi:hypothetical protein